MTITLDPALETALKEEAQRQGVAPDVLALNVLREQFVAPGPARPLTHGMSGSGGCWGWRSTAAYLCPMRH
jgi:hypothetical protein